MNRQANSATVWPESTARNPAGEMTIGGIAVPELAAEFGTPLYVFDGLTLRARAEEVQNAVHAAGGTASAVFAAKALSIPAIISLLSAYGLGIDVVSGGELHVALLSGVDPARITFHGSNKSRAELRSAIDAGVGLIVIDNLYEISLLGELDLKPDVPQSVLIRLNPGIDVHTHGKIATGIIDSKFGFPLWTDDAAVAVARVLETPGLELVGYHCHLGSQLFDLDAPLIAVNKMMQFAGEMRREHGVLPRIISPGGGMGISYSGDRSAADIGSWIAGTVAEVKRLGGELGFPVPQVIFEPGRYLVGQAGVAVYEVGSAKSINGVREYVSVDGGMADNIRPALYDAKYTADLASRRPSDDLRTVTIAGKYCESGDVLIQDIDLPPLVPGDLLALAAAGAYCIPLASNYNMAPRPAVVLVEDETVTLIRRRESFDDLLATSLMP